MTNVLTCRWLLCGTLIGGLLLAACDGGPTEPRRLQIIILNGDNQVGSAGATLPEHLAVRVTDLSGTPVPDVRVHWTVQESGGFVRANASPPVTDGGGVATISRTLGPNAGVHTTTAAIDGTTGVHVNFTSIAQVQGATRMTLLDGNGQQDTVLATLPAPLRVLVLDHEGAPVAGVEVIWTAPEATSTTDANGVAQVTHTLGARAGRQFMVASVRGLIGSPVAFEATATPGNPVGIAAAVNADGVGEVNSSLTYVVQATDSQGNLVDGVTIDWAVVSGGGSIYPTRGVTERSDLSLDRPVAIAAHSLGPDEGVHTVTATASSIPGAPQVTFTTMASTRRVSVEVPADDYLCFVYYICTPRPLFDPVDVAVPVGRTVGWLWGGVEQHNVVFEDDPTEPVSSPTQRTGRHFRTFTEPGTYRYRCTLHSTSFTQGMVGTVTVQ